MQDQIKNQENSNNFSLIKKSSNKTSIIHQLNNFLSKIINDSIYWIYLIIE